MQLFVSPSRGAAPLRLPRCAMRLHGGPSGGSAGVNGAMRSCVGGSKRGEGEAGAAWPARLTAVDLVNLSASGRPVANCRVDTTLVPPFVCWARVHRRVHCP